MPDPATLVVLRMLVPQIPQLLVVTAKHSLGMSSTSGKTDLQTVITVRTLRTFYSKEKKSQPISQLQAGMMQERGVRGNMWVATSTIPRPPNSDQDVGEELDLRNAVFQAVDSLSRSSEQTSTTYTKPELEDLEVEWVGYRAKPGKETLTEAEKYDRLMNEPSRTTDVTILYFHGGGWYMCDPRTHRGLASRIAKECHGRVCLPRFRLAPQTGFPGQLLDSLQVYLSLIYSPPGSMHAAVPARNIILAGESSGGNIAFSLVQLILQLQRSSANGVATIRFHGRKVEVPLPGGVSANSPTLDWSCSLPSRTQKETYPWDYLPAGKHDDCISHFPEEKGVWPTPQPRGDIYCDLALLDHPLVSPVVAQSWEGAPPMWISIGEERLQDENISLAKRAAQQGVKVTFDRYQAMPHAHTLCLPNTAWEKQCMRRWGQWAMDTVAQRIATKSIGTWIPARKALGKKKDDNECIQFNVAEMESLDFDEVLKLTSEGKLRRMAGFEELKIKLPYLQHTEL